MARVRPRTRASRPGLAFRRWSPRRVSRSPSRELELADEHAALDAAAFAPLVPGADAGDVRRALAEAIAAGDHDDDLTAIAAVLREHVRRKLAIARPGYD